MLPKKNIVLSVGKILISSGLFRLIGFFVLYSIPRVTQIGKLLDVFFFYQGLWSVIAGSLKEYFRVMTIKSYIVYFSKSKKKGLELYTIFLFKTSIFLFFSIFFIIMIFHIILGGKASHFRIFIFTGIGGLFLLVGGTLSALYISIKRYILAISQTPLVNVIFLFLIFFTQKTSKKFMLDFDWAFSNFFAFLLLLFIAFKFLKISYGIFFRDFFSAISRISLEKYVNFYKDYMSKFFPLILGFYIYAISPFIDQGFALFLEAGSVSFITYAFKISFIGFSLFYGLINTFFLREFHFISTKKFMYFLIILTILNVLYALTVYVLGKYILVFIFRGKVTELTIRIINRAMNIYIFSLFLAVYIEFFNKFLYSINIFDIPFWGGLSNFIFHLVSIVLVLSSKKIEMIPYTMLLSNLINIVVLSLFWLRKYPLQKYV